jgi:hypothetical protein
MKKEKEGSKMPAYKSLAAQEYQESKDKARYISIAQKLAQHINNLAEDKNTRIRWIWELIQNAKDVPNEFGRCRMRIEIRENKFIFAHNGDPFRVSDLESIVAQYSSKPEENKTQTETTGKYGTGFITTYILSRKVRIKGLLNLMTREEKEEAELKGDFKEEEEIEMEENEEIINKKPKSEKK